MTAFGVFRTLQLISAVCWAICLVQKTPPMLRVLRGLHQADDAIRMVIWFIAADQIGFVLRWFAFPLAITVMGTTELAWWSGLYTLSAMCALAISWVSRGSRKDVR